jgi:hypothetical protein
MYLLPCRRGDSTDFFEVLDYLYMVRQNQNGKFAKTCANKKAHNAYAARGGTLERWTNNAWTSGVKPHHRRNLTTNKKATTLLLEALDGSRERPTKAVWPQGW